MNKADYREVLEERIARFEHIGNPYAVVPLRAELEQLNKDDDGDEEGLQPEEG